MADDLTRDLLDDEGENLAVRSFLMQYSCDRSISVGQMRDHMARSGWGGGYFPTFAQGCAAATHLTKAGAQIWMRHLFSLEAAPSSLVADDDLPPLPKAAGMIEVETSTGWNTFADAYTTDQVRQAQREAVAFVKAAWEAEAKLGEAYKQIAWDAARQPVTVDSEPGQEEHTLFGMPIVIDDTVPPGRAEFRSGRRTITVDIQVDAAPAGGEERRD